MPIIRVSKQLSVLAVLTTALLPSSVHPTLRVPKLVLDAVSSGSVVIIGEHHRQPSSHRLFLDFIRNTAARGDRVLVGLEIPADRQGVLDAVLRGERSPEGLVHPIIDCLSYRALLEGLGDLVRERAGQVAVKALDVPSGSGQSREAAMAQEVLAAVRGSFYDSVAVLAGNLHALKEVPWSPVAAAAGPRLASLLIAAGLPVVSVLQKVEGECAGATEGSFYGAGEPDVARQVTSLWQGLNTEPAPPGLAGRAADGVIVWRCSD